MEREDQHQAPAVPRNANWPGVTDHAIKRVQRMVGDKYVAFVCCMHGGG